MSTPDPRAAETNRAMRDAIAFVSAIQHAPDQIDDEELLRRQRLVLHDALAAAETDGGWRLGVLRLGVLLWALARISVAALRELAETQGDSLEDMWQRLAAALNAELEP
jgi:hypothetical protein